MLECNSLLMKDQWVSLLGPNSPNLLVIYRFLICEIVENGCKTQYTNKKKKKKTRNDK